MTSDFLNDKPWNGQAVEIIIEDNIDVVVEEDARVTHVQLQGTIAISSGSIPAILLEKFVLSKVKCLIFSRGPKCDSGELATCPA